MLEAEKAQELLTKKIAACKTRGFLPSELIDLVEKIYKRQLEARGKAQIPAADTLETVDALQSSQGAPLMDRASFPFDREQTLELFHEFLDLAKNANTALSEAAAVIAAALADKSLDLDKAMQAHRCGDESFFATWAAATPSLERAAQELGTKANLKASWAHGHCPLCGSMPIMSDLREKEGFKYNICGFCHAEYHVPRLQCPFCLEKDTSKLEYYEAKEEPGLRINACKTCSMYIKQTDFRVLDRRSLPLVDDLDSLTLDVIAREKKFKRPTLSAWGF